MKIYKLFLFNEDKYKFENECKDKYEDLYEYEDFEKNFENFVENNKYKYKIIYKNQIYPLQMIFQIKGNKIENLKIKLICYNHIKTIPEILNDLLDIDDYKIEKFKKNMNMYKYIDYFLYSSHEIQKLIYNIDNEDRIQIFGEEFVENNSKKCLILYKNKIIPLQSYFLNKDVNKEDKENKKFEILLLELEDILDRSRMFSYCQTLVEFSSFEINNYKIKDNIIEEENYLNSEEIEKIINFYPNDIEEDIINKNLSNSCKKTLNFFKLKLDKLDKVKRNNCVFLNNMSHMFSLCSSLISLQGISKWNTNNVKDMSYMFLGCSSLISLPDISKWNTNNVKDMSYMFLGCSSLISLPDISNWNINNINNMSFIFNECSSLITLPDISKWNTNNVKNMSYLFSKCSSLISLPEISKWNTNNVNNMSYMFHECSSLITLPDISKWNTNNIDNISNIFFGCSSLLYLPDISKWNTNNIKFMNSIFYNCSSLISLPDISKWNTTNVKSISFMFYRCSSLISLPNISKWNTNNIDNVSEIFFGCSSLIYLPDIYKVNGKIINN